MATTPFSTIIDQLNLQTRLFKNVTAGIEDADAQKRQTPSTNHISWLAGHLVSTRYLMANVLGVQVSEPYPALFAEGKGLQEGTTYPALTDLTKDWDSISKALVDKLGTLSEADAAAAPPFPIPVAEQSIRGFINFTTHHEGYTIGQLGLLRRMSGYPAMKYD